MNKKKLKGASPNQEAVTPDSTIVSSAEEGQVLQA